MKFLLTVVVVFSAIALGGSAELRVNFQQQQQQQSSNVQLKASASSSNQLKVSASSSNELKASASSSKTTETTLVERRRDGEILFNFQEGSSALKGWYERSDAQFRAGAGSSKASLVSLESRSVREAVFFGLANAVDYTVGRATYIVEGQWDLSAYTTLQINCRSLTSEGIYYIGLRNNGVVDGPRNTVYVAELVASREFQTVEIPISAFAVVDPVGAKPLDTSAITSIALALHANSGLIGGVLEIKWIGAY